MKEFDLLIEHGIILTPFQIIENGVIGIKGGKISYIGKETTCTAKKKIDASCCIVMPGFINSHTHAAMVFLRGIADDIPLKEWLENHIWPLEAKFVSREWVRDASYLAILEMIKSGTTTFVDMYFFEDVVAEICEEVGIKGVLGEGILKFPTPSFKNPQDVFVFLKEFIENYKKSNYVYPAIAPHSVYATEKEQILKAYEIAEEYNLPFFLHASETEEENKESIKLWGKTPVSFLNSLGVLSQRTVIVHGVWIDEEEIKLLKEKETGVVHNPQSNLKLGSGIAPIGVYLEKKIKIGLGTDGAASNNDLDMFDEIRTTVLIHKGINKNPTLVPAKEVIKMATVGGAMLWGLNTGSIEEGRDADIIIVEANHPHAIPCFNPFSFLAYSAKSSDVKTVIINGKTVMENKQLLTLDEERILAKAEEWKKKIRK